jgi:hypothetical protein
LNVVVVDDDFDLIGHENFKGERKLEKSADKRLE